MAMLYENLVLDTSKDKWEMTDSGYLRIKATLASLGEQTYVENGMVMTHIVDESAIFDETYLKDIDGAALHLNHPVFGTKKHDHATNPIVGSTIEPKRNGERLEGTLYILDDKAIESVLSKKIGMVSMGYKLQVEPVSEGVVRQVSRVHDHTSLVKRGRCPKAKITVDHWIEPSFVEETEGRPRLTIVKYFI